MSLSGNRLGTTALWTGSAVLTVLFTLTTICWWMHAESEHSRAASAPGEVVRDPGQVNRVLGAQDSGGPVDYRIPTGVLVRTAEFLNSNDVKIRGRVWQRFGPDLPADMGRGIRFPEASGSVDLGEMTLNRIGDDDIATWSFNVTVRQPFDYRNFPLDLQDIWLRMSSSDLKYSVVLVPDFEEYPPWQGGELYGLDPGIVLPGWRLTSTEFSIKHTNYALKSHRVSTDAAELYFNTGIARELEGPLIGRMIPVVLLALLMFLSLFVITTDPDRRNLSGFTAFAIIGFAVSTVLVVAVNDNATRAEIGSSQIAYIEFWYFALYVMTLLVALNATLLLTNGLRGIVHWRGNLLPKLLFWPLFTGVLCLSTVLTLR
ncbi:hypothetical protein AB0N05_05055 [Nocardia sp. NPDC051030]|uniref:hypothetical protein n=1 Tax=Nocardia sp. NPDC051030 TaxID=3155162 RepID=UPI0034127099